MKLIKPISVLLAVLVLISSFTALSGCKTKKLNAEYDSSNIKTLASQTVAENDKLKLDYDNTYHVVSITNKESGKVWSTLNKREDGSYETTATLDATVQDMEIYQSVSLTGETPYNDGKISVEKIENGVELTYYFEEQKIAIPVAYTLAEDSMKLTIDSSKIVEGDPKFRLVNAKPTPNMCEIPDEAEDSYLLLPSGSGALIHVGDDADAARNPSLGPVSATALSSEYSADSTETTRMPVFGAKWGNDAFFCIAEKSPGAVGVSASAGDKRSDFASITPNVYFIDYDYLEGKAANAGSFRQLSERTQNVITIGYYFLSNEKANYMGMAECFKNYLTKKGLIEKKEANTSPYSVTLYGGVLTTKSIIGIPVTSLKTMTTLKRAQEIVSELSELTAKNPVVRLEGYGESGVNYGKIAGGFEIDSKLGNKKDIKAIEDYAKQNDISLYFNFETIKYAKSGNGFSYNSDAAKTAILHTAEKSGVGVPLRDAVAVNSYRFLARNQQGKVIDKLLKFTNKQSISGINLSSLGKFAYSDYDKKFTYSLSDKTEEDTKELITQIKENGNKVSGSASSYFAAGIVDTIFDVNLNPNGSYLYDQEIPFYQIVFSGVTPMYSEALNTVSNPKEIMARAASTGLGLSFSVIDQFHISYMQTNAKKLYACDYEANKEFITTCVEQYKDVYAAICGAVITNYEIMDNGVTVTTFENGCKVYANISAFEAESDVGTLAAYEFKLGGDK